MSGKPAALREAIGRVILGKDEAIDLALTCLFARGHLLIEDVPGIGKTTLAQALARSINCSFRRVQFTSDLLPSDILGVKVIEPGGGEFRFLPGPIFNSIVLADEINRTTPRTQSALLEAMSENQVTIEGETRPLPLPFMVIATQNPIEHYGTYPLPDSQLDRFTMSISLGYPGEEHEKKILGSERADPSSDSVKPVMEAAEVVAWQEKADEVKMAPEIVDYLLALVGATRKHPSVRLGVSPRGSLALQRAARARAVLDGRDYCLPDDVKHLARPVLAHRLIQNGQSTPDQRRQASRDIIDEILDSVPVPA